RYPATPASEESRRDPEEVCRVRRDRRRRGHDRLRVRRHRAGDQGPLDRQQLAQRREDRRQPDMTPAANEAEVEKAGLENVDLPTCTVAGKAVNDGSSARCFAQYMRIHALLATG